MSKMQFLTKTLDDGTPVSFKFGVRCWTWFSSKYNTGISSAFQKIVKATEESPNGDINIQAAMDMLIFAAKDAAISQGQEPENITEEKVFDWIEELGMLDFISEAVEFAAQRITDQTKKPAAAKQAPVKKKK